MINPFFNFFNADRPFIDPDSSKWPAEWKTVCWKEYDRFERIDFSKPSLPPVSLVQAIVGRKSVRKFYQKPLTLKELSNILFYSCGLVMPKNNLKNGRRAQPSGGGLYPLEVYPIIFYGNNEVGAGIYHYNVLRHCLERFPEGDSGRLKDVFRYPWVKDSSCVLVFSFNEDRTMPKYGNLAYKVGLIEAGHIGQNIYLICSAMGLKCCALGAMDEEIIHRELNMDGIGEVAFYAIAVGK